MGNNRNIWSSHQCIDFDSNTASLGAVQCRQTIISETAMSQLEALSSRQTTLTIDVENKLNKQTVSNIKMSTLPTGWQVSNRQPYIQNVSNVAASLIYKIKIMAMNKIKQDEW